MFRAADGRWRAALSWRDATGKLVRRSASARSEEEARTALARLRLQGAEPLDNVTLGDWAAHWEEHILPGLRISPYTKANYQKWLPRFAPLSGVALCELKVAHVEAVLKEMAEQGKSWNTCRLAKAALSSVLGSALRRDMVDRNVATLAQLPSEAVRPKEHRVWGRAELARFVAALDGERDAGYWLTMLLLGLRPGEAAALRRCDVDLDAETLYVAGARVWTPEGHMLGPTKTTRGERVLELPPEVRRAMREALARTGAGPDDALLFPSATGRLRDPSNDRRRLTGLCARAGVPRQTPYELRHTAASHLSDLGVPIELAADQLGHATTQMLQRVYRHPVRKVVRTGVDWSAVTGRAETPDDGGTGVAEAAGAVRDALPHPGK